MTVPVYHRDITKKITKKDPFKNCKLDRKKYAEILTDSLSISQEGFVLALNNEWGTGKTTFLKMWQILLESKGYKTLYFNAWENDYEEDILLSIIAEFTRAIDSNSAEFNALLNCAAPLSKPSLSKVSKAISSGSFDSETLQEAIALISGSISMNIENRIKELSHRRDNVNDFKKALGNYVQKDKSKKFILIVDELDRCKPTYAVKVLETIKHLFVVPGIVFVLGIDKEQLCSSIKGYYGSGDFNAEEYLKRFIDIEYSLPKTSSKVFTLYLLEYYNFSEFTKNIKRIQLNELKDEAEDLTTFTSSFFELKEVSLRNQERILAHARLALNSIKYNQYLYPEVFIFMLYIKITKNTFYKKIINRKLTLNQLIEGIDELFPDRINSPNQYITLINKVILMYNLSRDSEREIIFIDSQKTKLNFKSKLYNYIDENTLAHWFQLSWSFARKYEISLKHVLDRVELVNEFISDSILNED